MTDAREAPFNTVRLADVVRATDIDPDYPDATDGEGAGTLVFVRDPAIIRSARATADGTSILAIGGRPGSPFEISRWERAWFS
jgi:hypothetical protein